jgi:hypothetical protein
VIKAFVYDKSHAGAEIYFSESREKAIAHFRDAECKYYENFFKQHTGSDSILQTYVRCYEFVKSSEFDSNVEEHEIVDGYSFYTEGE